MIHYATRCYGSSQFGIMHLPRGWTLYSTCFRKKTSKNYRRLRIKIVLLGNGLFITSSWCVMACILGLEFSVFLTCYVKNLMNNY